MKNYLIKLVFFAAILLINSGQTKAQDVAWAKMGVSQGFENGNAVCTDDSGNVYVTGQFEYISAFDPFYISARGQHDIMTIKYTADGDIKWIRKAGGRGGDIGNGIGIDAAHNVYITGEVEDTVSFGNGISLISAGSNDIFIAKYDVSGNILWAKRFGSELGSDKGRALTVSPSGNCYLTGNYTYSTDFDATTLSTMGNNDLFVLKVNTDGNVVWAKSAGGGDEDRGYGIAIDATENVFVTGTFSVSANFGNITVTNQNTNSTFLAKYNSNGQVQWVTTAGACCDTTKSNAIALDDNGNIYLTGQFKHTSIFGMTNMTAHGNGDIFIAKFDPSGNALWAKQAGGSSEDAAYGIAVDPLSQLVYITGFVQGNGNFDANTYTVNGYKDAFVAAYNLNGANVWVKTYGGTERDLGSALAVDKSGFIYNTGLFNDTVAFGAVSLNGYPIDPKADFYISKISPAQGIIPATQASNLSHSLVNCSDLNISVTPGNGSGRVIFMRAGAAVNIGPVNGTSYTGDNAFGNGSAVGNDIYVVSAGTASSVTVTNLTPGTTYYFDVFEYSGYGTTSNYLVASPAYDHVTITVPSISVTGFQNSICNGESVNLQATGGSTYSWSPSNGLSSTTGSSVTAQPTATTDYTLTGTTSSGCIAQSNFTVTVNQKPSVSFAALNSICANGSPVALTGGTPAGGTYSGNGVSNGQFNPGSLLGTTTIQYSYTDANGCSNNAQSSIHVNSVPVVSLSTLPSVCINGSPVTLTGGNPAGGTYSGNGVSNGQFNPAGLRVGNALIQYTYTDANGCSNNAQSSIRVNSIPAVSFSTLPSLCENSGMFTLTGGLPAGGTYSGTGVTSGIFNPAVGVGTYQITYTYTNSNGCTSNSNQSEIVKANPVINLGSDILACAGAAVSLDAGAGFSSYLWSTGASTQSIVMNGITNETHNVSVVVKNADGCSATDQILVRFDLCSGIETMPSMENVSIYPNPFTDGLSFKTEKMVSFSILDACGRVIAAKENVSGTISAGEDLAPGVYFINVFSGTDSKTYRVLKQK